MDEWSVIGVLVVLVGLFATVGAPISKLIESITKLTVTVQSLQADMEQLTAQNGKSHERIFARLDEHEGRLGDHEARIGVIEERTM